MVGAIVVGAVLGAIAFLPLVFGMQKARNATPTSNLGHAGALLLGVLLSFVLLAAGLVTCAVFFRDLVAPFGVAEAAALVVSAAIFGITKMVRK